MPPKCRHIASTVDHSPTHLTLPTYRPPITSYYFESLEKDINQGSGSVNALMRDSIMADHLRATIENAERGIAAFAEDMEALKSSSTSFSLLHHCIHDVIKLLSELTLAY